MSGLAPGLPCSLVLGKQILPRVFRGQGEVPGELRRGRWPRQWRRNGPAEIKEGQRADELCADLC